MKVAVSTDNGYVSAHFGRCPEFTILDINDGKIISRHSIPNPEHEPGFLPGFFAEMGVQVVIAGGGGQRAQMLFAKKNIQFILGVTGKVDEVVDKLSNGELQGGESLCNSSHGNDDSATHNCHHK
jgi:predicted Fe-Mo cluster-binding NifX family protein